MKAAMSSGPAVVWCLLNIVVFLYLYLCTVCMLLVLCMSASGLEGFHLGEPLFLNIAVQFVVQV